MNQIIVSKNEVIKSMLVSMGLCDTDTPIVFPLTREEAVGKHVFGAVPLHLCALAEKVTTWNLPPMEGAKLSGEELAKKVKLVSTYKIELENSRELAEEAS